MIFYWDTSAIINAAVSEAVQARLDQNEHVTRLHAFSEFFAIMTGRGIAVGSDARVAWSPQDTIEWMRAFAAKVRCEEFSAAEFFASLQQVQQVQGARIYDFGHALSAIKAKADVVLTRNPSDFIGLVGNAKIEYP